MIKLLSNKIIEYLIAHNTIQNTNEDIEHYKYGIEITISSLLNIILVLILGILLRVFLYSIIFLIVFISLRHLTGGYHANTYFKCNLSLCIVFCLVVISSKILKNYIDAHVIIFYLIFSSLIITAFCPVSNKNKPISPDSIQKYKFASLLLSYIYSIIGFYIANYSLIIESYIITTIIYINILVIVSQLLKKEGNS